MLKCFGNEQYLFSFSLKIVVSVFFKKKTMKHQLNKGGFCFEKKKKRQILANVK